jgi:hypothetical protein
MGHNAADRRKHQPDGDRGDEREIVRHLSPCVATRLIFTRTPNIIWARPARACLAITRQARRFPAK